jgi:single-strand DNA-binding protein
MSEFPLARYGGPTAGHSKEPTMASYNRIILAGNLTRDPELSYTPGNVAVCRFGIATNTRWRDREGNMREEVCFVDCTVFGRRAETFNQYMSKGRSALVEGRLQLDQWTSQDGQKHSRHKVVVDNFTFLGGAPGAGARGDTAATAGSPAPGGSESDYDGPPPPADEDIPF